MEDPQIRLETIMRQAEGSGIIQASKIIRETGSLDFDHHGGDVLKTRDHQVMHMHNYRDINSIVLCALNKTRVRINSFARQKIGIVDLLPIVGEPVICLYNNRRKLIYNGNIGIIKNIKNQRFTESGQEVIDVDIDMGDFVYSGAIAVKQFGQEYTMVEEKDDEVDFFDWAYCITVHKAQGSEWQNVLVIEEGEFMFRGDMWKRWLYTATTRAKENLTIYKR
jgi:exodeoxyribonuclease-5